MNKIGVFYGSTTGTTEDVAHRIAEKLNVPQGDIHDVSALTDALVKEYGVLVLGTSTWGVGELQDDWYGFLDQLKAQDLSGKKVALFGCGDSGSYPDTFCDAVGLIYDGLQQSGCTFVGAYAPEGYDETGSLVCRGGKFVGLAVDESAPDKTDRRVAAWCEQIKNE